ncbi:MAG: adenine nucleotide alpha hydrolase [Winogradskyella sp.]|uniref:adenine nucleotide alpha hydrolase n=1 Tax=Winogradskyella sp. TaxID=1883156 RepID=UPI0025D420C4|nr:adenine nucleotide alpha hydrolase [Winogradskyella sp.]NRB59304.1 adenine nucleotide alpha hydrolase [Winogradskyella sp.]
MTHKTYFNWSSGKDSALALFYLLQNKKYSIEKLLTTTNEATERVTMHGLREELLIKQIESIEISSHIIKLPKEPSMEIYNDLMTDTLNSLKKEGFTHAAFGDIFLEDLRMYRDAQLSAQNIETIYPLWKKNTSQLINEFIELGFKTIVVSASAKYFDKRFVGTIIDKDFIDKLPKDVDPCGENGEFHTFCFDGPIFKQPINFGIGQKVYREYKAPKTDTDNTLKEEKRGFWYVDLFSS